jgi:RsiW-degrading membrane proteinase PrsW (M82 family)
VLYGPPTKVNRGESLDTVYAFLGLIPGAAWLLYFRWRSWRYSTSFLSVLRVFLWACFCTILAGVVERVVGASLPQETLLNSALVGFFLIAPIEECAKLIAVWKAAYRSPEFRDPMHGLLFAATAACAFVSMENWLHIAQMGPEAIPRRLFFATPAHLMFSSMWGYGLGVARFQRKGEIGIIAKGLVASVFFHGLYNLVVAVNPKLAMITLLPLMIVMGALMYRMISRFRNRHPFQPMGCGALILCPNCGVYATEGSERCIRCGIVIPTPEPDAPRFCANCRTLLESGNQSCRCCRQPIDIPKYCMPQD